MRGDDGINHQFYVMKFASDKLNALNYCLDTTFAECQEFGEIISLAGSQEIRSILDIRRRRVDEAHVERLWQERKELRRRLDKLSAAKGKRAQVCRESLDERLGAVEGRIDRTLFVPDYLTVEMKSPAHYRHIFKHGIMINGKTYHRFSCSAGQARVSTVVLVCDEVAEELERRLNNGRDMTQALAPSKFNAYFGLASSATKEVTEPRFIVVKDYENIVRFRTKYLIEQDWNKDDLIEEREIEMPMNRTDGMGLISPAMAKQWVKDLGLDYVPGQFIVRQNFIKGMLCVFDFQMFCEEVNGGKYLVDTIYTDSHGKPIQADLRYVDVILSESQFKLWEGFPSIAAYVENCHRNKLTWGVTQYAVKQAKEVMTLNYQFIQTLNLSRRDVEELCEPFIRWIEGVSVEDRAYMLLFLLGENNTEESLRRFLRKDDGWWIKALAAHPEVMKDPFVLKRIRELIIGRIQAGCMGEVIVPGNFQIMVSDPYAFCQHVCGLPVTGLLKEGEHYSHWWNKKGVQKVDAMRSPMTDRSEHVVLNLVRTSDTEKWYCWCDLGIIYNWFGNETVRHAGADFDGDLVATTDSPVMLRSVYTDELPVTYDVPKPKKFQFTKADLFQADLFGFGSIIGSITNKSTAAYALLPLLEEAYGKDSEEVKLTLSRLKQCCVAQSKQIDKTKLGQVVKGIPKDWVRVDKDAPSEVLRHALLNKQPYFFKFRYAKAKREYCLYEERKQCMCKALFGKSIKQLEELPRKTEEQWAWLQEYHDRSPLIVSDAPMNRLCKHIESVDFSLAAKVKSPGAFDWRIYQREGCPYEEYYQDIVACYRRHLKDVSQTMATMTDKEKDVFRKTSAGLLREKMRYITVNPGIIVNALVEHLYHEKPNGKKNLLWEAYGRTLFANVMAHAQEPFCFPLPDEGGEVVYLGKRYSLQEVAID